jgi:diadenosine tetraphosphate (Ap4A) HIT family hydrolase
MCEIALFCIDERIISTSFILGDWPLSRVLLKNESQFPWFILVPRVENIQEIYQLAKENQQVLMEEINQLSLLVNHYFNPDKLNIGALGNVVPQLHVHLIARNKHDAMWPQGIWQSALNSRAYERSELNPLLADLKDLIGKSTFCNAPG